MIQPIPENPTFLVLDLGEEIWQKLEEYCDLLREWNAKINLVSHEKTPSDWKSNILLSCLTITKFLRLMPKLEYSMLERAVDFLASHSLICYPQARFTLMDSIGKKVMVVVEDMIKRLELSNVEVRRGRVEELPKKKTYDFVIGRAVTALPTF